MPLRLQRLTRDQYAATLRDLLGDTTDVTAELPVDTAGDTGFVQPGPVGALEARRFMDLAEGAAARAVRDLRALTGCEVADAACAKAFLPRFLKRAYRRPPTAEELAAVEAHHAAVRALPGQDAAGALRATLAAVLQSPSFLYRWELGPRRAPRPGANGQIALDDYELASRLSYFVVGTMPDEALFTAADAGKLRDPAALGAEARRLLATPAGRRMLRSFHAQWLGLGRILDLEKDTAVYKGFEEIRRAMDEETGAFIDHVVFEGDGKVDTLFSASFGFVNATLAKVYGLTGVSGSTLRKQPLDPEQRFGIMTQGTFLATHAYPHDSAPVKRGVAVREALLCQTVPSPPRDLLVDVPEPDPKKTVREQFEQHAKDPSCSGCHALFDPLGFAFEHYDGIGRHRTMAAGKPVDASGMLIGLADGPKAFRNLRDLMNAVRASREFRDCVVGTWLRFALGRREGEGDAESLRALARGFEASGQDLRELVVALVQTPSFRFRTPASGEVLQ
jgi:hypothetical protein